MCLTLFSCEADYTEIFFLIWAKWIFLWVHLDRQKIVFFLCVYFFFLCGLTHRKISFNLDEKKISVCVRPTEKIWFFCHYISVGIFLMVHRQKKKFLTGFVFFCVFSHTQKKKRDSSSVWACNLDGTLQVKRACKTYPNATINLIGPTTQTRIHDKSINVNALHAI